MNPLQPIRYQVRLAPDLDAFTFAGEVTLFGELDRPADIIELNALELDLKTCRITVGEQEVDCRAEMVPEKETVRIVLPEKVRGGIRIHIGFTGRINDRMAGFYRSRYLAAGKERYIGVTQFQESDARRCFPCLDHPRQKAVFEIALTIPPGLVALSNQPIQETRMLADGKREVRFDPTPSISTYLLFVGVGEFELVEDSRGKVLVRGATVPGRSRYTGLALDFGRKALEYCEAYFDIPYPLEKLDLIAVPDFAFGAMENWGAITFRENLLLYYPGVTSRLGEQRICEVIAHEIAHQWFGNLVTPSDWKYLWLNESFATYFGFGVVDHYHPDWDTWGQFIHGQTEAALERDALQETTPIEIPGGDHIVINSSTAPIIYSKGGSMLRQVMGYIGEENFQAGLRHYLKTHAYGCAESRDLWQAFEAASQAPVTALVQNWIEQKGFPKVTADRKADRLVLSQERFTYLPGEYDQKWLIPVNLAFYDPAGRVTEKTVLMEERQAVVEMPAGTRVYKVNAGQSGFYRVHYREKDNLTALGEMARDRKLGAEDRWGLENDLFALVLSGAVSLAAYLDFLRFFEAEDAYLPLASIAGHLAEAHLVVDGAGREQIAALGRQLWENVLSRLGYTPRDEEPQAISILRDQLVWQAVLFGSRPLKDFARERFQDLLAGRPVHADLVRGVMQAGALAGGGETLDWLQQRFQTAESEHERMNILAALGSFREAGVLEQALDYVLHAVPDRNKYLPVAAMGYNPHAAPRLWDWFVKRLAAFEAFHPLHFERVIGAVVPVGGLERPEEVEAFFAGYLKQKQTAGEVIRLSLERLAIHVRMRSAHRNGD